MLAVFLGGSGIVHDAASGTRYALVLESSSLLSLAAGAAAALAPIYPRLLGVAAALASALIAGADALRSRARPQPAAPPRVARRPRATLVGAAVWFGGLVALVFALPRASADDAERNTIVRAVLDRRARVRVRARRQRPRPRADRARRRDRDLVDVVRPRADRQDRALRAVARARLAQPLAAPRQLRPPAPLGAARDGAAARDRRGRRGADRAPARRRGERVGGVAASPRSKQRSRRRCRRATPWSPPGHSDRSRSRWRARRAARS